MNRPGSDPLAWAKLTSETILVASPPRRSFPDLQGSFQDFSRCRDMWLTALDLQPPQMYVDKPMLVHGLISDRRVNRVFKYSLRSGR